MKFIISLIYPMIMVVVAHAESDFSEFEAKVIAELGKLAQKNMELEKKLETTKVELKKIFSAIETERTYEAFDCYRNEIWDINGTITFNGCSGTIHQCSVLILKHL